jgi:hypothetical protein
MKRSKLSFSNLVEPTKTQGQEQAEAGMGNENSGRIRVIGALAGVGSGQLPHGFRH